MKQLKSKIKVIEQIQKFHVIIQEIIRFQVNLKLI